MKKPFYYHTADNGYIYDKRIFWSMLFLVVLSVGYVAYTENFDFSYKFYINCNSVTGEGCENLILTQKPTNPNTGYEYYKDCTAEWCSKKILPIGEYGRKPSFFIENFSRILLALVGLSLGLNHLVHNRGKFPYIKLNVSDKVWNRIKEGFKKITDKVEDEEEGEE